MTCISTISGSSFQRAVATARSPTVSIPRRTLTPRCSRAGSQPLVDRLRSPADAVGLADAGQRLRGAHLAGARQAAEQRQHSARLGQVDSLDLQAEARVPAGGRAPVALGLD